MATTDTTGTCASCLSTVRLMTTGKPVRHGFSIVGAVAGHGLNGTWHTGPCMGTAYLHLGLSTDGSKAVLARCEADLASTIKHQAALATTRATRSPVSELCANDWKAKRETRTFLIEYGARPPTRTTYSVPTWEDVVGGRERAAQAQVNELRRMIAMFTEVITTWTSAKYPVVTIATKGPVIHQDAAWGKNSKQRVALCQRWAFHPSASLLNADANVVTCTRCLKAVETAKKDAAKRAATAAKDAARAAKEAAI